MTTTPNRTVRRGLSLAVAALAISLLAGCLSTDQSTEITMINGTRKDHRKSALSADAKAASKAQAWSEHMAQTGKLEHTGGGSKLSTTGLGTWCGLAENVGTGPSLAGIHQAFLDSPGHKANMLGNYHRVGTGVAKKGRTYWVTQIYLKNC